MCGDTSKMNPLSIAFLNAYPQVDGSDNGFSEMKESDNGKYILAVKDGAGNYTKGSNVNNDTVAQTSTKPAAGEQNIDPKDKTISITYDKKIQGQASIAKITVSDDLLLSRALDVDPNGKTLTIKLDAGEPELQGNVTVHTRKVA